MAAITKNTSTKELEIRLREIEDDWSEMQNCLMKLENAMDNGSQLKYTTEYINSLGDHLQSICKERDDIADILSERALCSRLGFEDFE